MTFYTTIIKGLMESLGVEVMLPPPITEETARLGVKHSSLMMCYPFKVTLGSFLEVLERAKKENKRLTYFGVGTSSICMTSCRYQQYYEIHKKIAESLGYDFDTVLIEKKMGNVYMGVFDAFKRLNPENSYYKILRELLKAVRIMKKEERKNNFFDWNDHESVRIGIVGEYYTVVESAINYNIFNKLREMGVNVHTFIKYSSDLKLDFSEELPRRFKKEARRYYKGDLRAQGNNSHAALYFYKHKNFDAVIHLMPLSCMPEVTAAMVMDLTAEKLDLPLYRFEIDETNSEANVNTRFEATIELLKRKKGIK